MKDLNFNPSPSLVMHIDLNSCFATIEQQANPFYRGKPIAVAAYNSPGGCILAPSVEAKRYGIKTGMRVKDGKRLFPRLIVVDPDPDKYRAVHKGLRTIFASYTNEFSPKSIDEFVLNLAGYPALKASGMFGVAREIKERIKDEIGEWLTVSVGIAPNRFLAKTAAGLRKPDGLDEINYTNYKEIFTSLELTDLCGINIRNAIRLKSVGINSVWQMYNASVHELFLAFRSIGSYYWYLRLRGWEIDSADFGRKSFGNSYAMPKSTGSLDELAPILLSLVEKTGQRMRKEGYKTKGVWVSLSFRDGGFWHKSRKLTKELFDSRDIFREMMRTLAQCPFRKPVRTLSESCFNLSKSNFLQGELFEDISKKNKLSKAIDDVNLFWGTSTVKSATALKLQHVIHDRIAFGQPA